MLQSVNMLLDNPLTPQQIEALVTHAERDRSNGHVAYGSFLNSFSVLDAEEHPSHQSIKETERLVSTASRHSRGREEKLGL